jgi:hypothetical protein
MMLPAWVQVAYPAPFEGEWAVSAHLSNVAFPDGKRGLELLGPQGLKVLDATEATEATCSMPCQLVMRLWMPHSPIDAALFGLATRLCQTGTIIIIAALALGLSQTTQSHKSRSTSPAASRTNCRVFDERELVDAFLGYPATQEVQHSRDKNPQNFAIVYATPRRGQSQSLQALDPHTAELRVAGCSYGGQGGAFLAVEAFRKVQEAQVSSWWTDYDVELDVLQRFEGVGSNEMAVDLRVRVLLVSESLMDGFVPSETRGNDLSAKAQYEYKLTYKRSS